MESGYDRQRIESARKASVDASIADALYTYPLEPTPVGIMPVVMRRVEIIQPLPRFRLQWLDYALSLFLAGIASLMLLLTRAATLPPSLIPVLETRFIVFWQQFTLAIRPLDPVIFLTLLGMGGGLCLVATWVFLSSRIQRLRFSH